ncbi:hypothetical protein D9M72_645870 [compost metagenome]
MSSRASAVRPGLLERITMLLERGSASTTMSRRPFSPLPSSSSVASAAMSVAMPLRSFTSWASSAVGVSMLSMMRASRSRLSM